MRIKQILNQHRRDFQAIYECEHCGYIHTSSGYDDSYFHKEVIPKMYCAKCGETADASYIPRSTKYDDGVRV